MAEIKPDIETFPKIKVVGLGGGGGAAVNRMITDNIKGVDFIVVNTDVQALNQNLAPTKIAIGKTLTRGLGAGMDPEVGRQAAEENENELRESLKDTNMVFLTCGLGGGTGTGSIPEVAKIAKDLNALTVAVVTKPFSFEGAQRRRIADEGYEQLIQHVDAVITIPNDRVLQIIDKKTSLMEAFSVVDDVLRQGVQGIAELITIPGLINVDFADVKAIMENSGSALMGIGRAIGENRAVEAAKQAIASPLLELSVDGAKGILFTITGGTDLGMHEVAEAAKIITSSADEDAKVIFGANIDEDIQEEVRITVVATGFDTRDRFVPAMGSAEVATQGTWSPNQYVANRDRKEEENKPEPLHSSRPKIGFRSKSIPSFNQEEEERSEPARVIEPVKNDYQPINKPISNPISKPIISSKPINQPLSHKTQEEEEIEIPAFIRKKMM